MSVQISSESSLSSSNDVSSVSWSSDSNRRNDISLFHMNIRSLRNKVDDLSSFAYQYDVVACTETWLNDSVTNDKIVMNGSPY